MIELLSFALELSHRTLGAFEPGILRTLAAKGYDRSFELIDKGRRFASPEAIGVGGTIRDVVLNRPNRSVLLPPDLRLDLGGIGKGFAVDRASTLLRGAGGFSSTPVVIFTRPGSILTAIPGELASRILGTSTRNFVRFSFQTRQ
jgi:thiamine biosynthesis lipoprotein